MFFKTMMATAAALIAAALAAGPAAAQSPPQPRTFAGSVMFNLIDRNADGVVDQAEADAVAKAFFAAADEDKNGTLSASEVAAALRQHAAGMVERGGINVLHHQRARAFQARRGVPGVGPQGAGPQQGFRFGPQGPGPGPLAALPPGQQVAPPPPPPRQAAPAAGPNQPGQQQPRRLQRQPGFAAIDANGDGQISPDEFAAAFPRQAGG
jgi:hypothetical protein